jgi:hypothetical protein
MQKTSSGNFQILILISIDNGWGGERLSTHISVLIAYLLLKSHIFLNKEDIQFKTNFSWLVFHEEFISAIFLTFLYRFW